MAHTSYVIERAAGQAAHPADGSSPVGNGYSPTQLLTAYGFTGVPQDGTGQTIAIIDAYNDPNIASDLATFDGSNGFSLPTANLTVVNETGGSKLPTANSSWAVETSLDVEWAHALAPGAKILLVEANSANTNDLFAAARYAASQPDVSVVSMSFGAGEYSGEVSDDVTYFQNAATSGGVSFVAATGDGGSPASYPAYSPYVVAVGGTSLSLNPNNTIASESAWNSTGGGLSTLEPAPTYQNGLVISDCSQTVNANGMRAVPDVAFNADPNTGVPIYDTYNNPYGGPWVQVGGTSAATPSWAAIIARADQARAENSLGSLDGYTQTLPYLYAHPGDFNDITTGGNGTYNAGPGYDLVTGLGSPMVNILVPGLAGEPPGNPPTVTMQPTANPTTVTANTTILNVLASDSVGDASPTYSWTSSGPNGAKAVTFSSNNSAAASTTTATFYQAGTYTFTATITDPTSDLSVTSNSVTVTVAQTLTSITVSHSPATVVDGTTQHFTATGLSISSAMR